MSTRCPRCPTDPGDRNRTSPFAFTGNRFEFRAPGSGQTVAVPLIVLNTIMADSLDYMATKLEKAVRTVGEFDKAVQTLLTEIITEHGDVVYNGDGYRRSGRSRRPSEACRTSRRRWTPSGADQARGAVELFEKYGVFNERELHSRYEVGLEQYALTVAVEAKLALEIGSTIILPAAIRYQTELAQERRRIEGRRCRGRHLRTGNGVGSDRRSRAGVGHAEGGAVRSLGGSALDEAAKHAQQELLPAMDAVRTAADALEGVVADDLWPLPTYQEMLYVL